MNDVFLNSVNAPYIAELFFKFRNNPTSVDSSWKNFFQSLNDDDISILKDFGGPEWRKRNTKVIDNNYTFIRIRPNTKTYNNGYKSNSTNKIYNTIELSNNEVCDTYNIRSIIEIEENVKLELSLNQITFNNEHLDLDTNEKISSLFLPVTSQPIVFQIKVSNQARSSSSSATQLVLPQLSGLK